MIQISLIGSRWASFSRRRVLTFGFFRRNSIQQYLGQFCLRGSRTSPPILRLCYPIQPSREKPHATASECTAHVTPNQETATKVPSASVGTSAYAPRPCHVAASEPLQFISREDLCTLVRQRL